MFTGVGKVHVKMCKGELGKLGTKREEVETKGRFRSSRFGGWGWGRRIWFGGKGGYLVYFGKNCSGGRKGGRE